MLNTLRFTQMTIIILPNEKMSQIMVLTLMFTHSFFGSIVMDR